MNIEISIDRSLVMRELRRLHWMKRDGDRDGAVNCLAVSISFYLMRIKSEN